jgi:enoyl-CoA hydratase
MADPRVRLDMQGPRATLTLARPEKLNALDADMLEALSESFDLVEADAGIRVLVLTGQGRIFCAGGDIAAWGKLPRQAFGQDWVRLGHRVFDRLAGLRMPVIAAINGHALGGGLELAAAADLRIARSEIRIGMPETSLGMVPGWSGTQRMLRRFGAQAVRRMVLGGELFSGREALDLGIVDACADEAGFDALVEAQAARIAGRSPVATSIAKLMIAGAETGDASAIETLGSVLAAGTGDMQTGVAAFAGKTSADFKGSW